MTSAIGGIAGIPSFITPTGSGGIAARNSTDIVDNPTGLAMGASVPALTGLSSTAAPGAVSDSSGFAGVLASTFDQLQATQTNADGLAAQAVTGDLKDVHDYMIARSEASLAVEMVVSVKNKAVEAFNEIMRMPV